MEITAASKPRLLRRGSAWAKAPDAAYALLWFEYLKISPSYELARRYRTGAWTAADQARRPEDFDSVLAVYDDLGDVRSLLFREWWLKTGIDYFGYQGTTPRVTSVGSLHHTALDQNDKLVTNFKAYADGPWQEQGKPTAMVVAIPVGLTKAQIAQQVATLMAENLEARPGPGSNPPKYILASRKLDSKSLFKYLMCVWVKAKSPKMSLWRIGVYAKVSLTYSARLDAKAELVAHEQFEDRNALKIVTSRAISRGLLIAENAARGHFPTYAKSAQAIAPDWGDLNIAVGRRIDLDKKR